MNSRIALAIFALLILTVAVGWLAAPDAPHTSTAVYTEPTTTAFEPVNTATASDSTATTAMIIGCMIIGAAAIGLVFFGPCSTQGPRVHGAPEIAGTTTDFASTWVTPGVRPEVAEYSTAGPPCDSRGTYLCAEVAGRRTGSFVECAWRGLAHLHQELEVVLALLQSVDQQIDRLMRVQAGQYAAQLVQHRGLVWAEQ